MRDVSTTSVCLHVSMKWPCMLYLHQLNNSSGLVLIYPSMQRVSGVKHLIEVTHLLGREKRSVNSYTFWAPTASSDEIDTLSLVQICLRLLTSITRANFMYLLYTEQQNQCSMSELFGKKEFSSEIHTLHTLTC